MKAAELYAQTLHGYSNLLPVLKVSFSQYCKEHKVNYRGLCTWMRENRIPVPRSKQSFHPSLMSPSLAPVSILAPESSGMNPSCPSSVAMLKDVQITCPNGIHVSIREISGNDMSVLIAQLNQRWNYVCVNTFYVPAVLICVREYIHCINILNPRCVVIRYRARYIFFWERIEIHLYWSWRVSVSVRQNTESVLYRKCSPEVRWIFVLSGACEQVEKSNFFAMNFF